MKKSNSFMICLALLAVPASSAFAKTVNLDDLVDHVTLQDEDVLTGTLDGAAHPYQISIAADAKVTLDNVIINGYNSTEYRWAGLNCLGDCNIVLVGENTVKGFFENNPGIYVPEDGTLTISGTGSLDASSNGEGAGIGGGYGIDCGNIVLESGNIIATGDGLSAGIGSGFLASSGSITIAKGDELRVTAIKGADALYSIGEGLEGSLKGSITIDGLKVGSVKTSPFTFPVENAWTVSFNSNGGIGTMEPQTIFDGVEAILDANSFVREGYSFAGWNTKADGSGTPYDNGDFLGIAEYSRPITLYAQWLAGTATDIATVGDAYVAKNGEVLTGSIDGRSHPSRISIADGATVTLMNVNINGFDDKKYSWAGITCDGDCDIILVGVNKVRGFYTEYPGILVPVGKTLTISGMGSLEAGSHGFAPGIGGRYGNDCGNITITGGTITASGVFAAVGIGGGVDACAGDITITDDVTKVTAIAGDYEDYGIGNGSMETCGKITIGGRDYADGVEEPLFVYPAATQYAAVEVRDYNSGKRAIIDGTYDGLDAVKIPGEIEVASVVFNRAFTKNAYSTIMLPFDVNTANVEGLDMVLRFNGIGLDAYGKKAVKMKIVWDESRVHTDLKANSPYLVLMNDETFRVNGGVTLKKTKEAVKASDGWEFRGTWQFKSWDENDAEMGKAYGFAASTDDNIVAGEFVKVGVGAWINPMRAYLVNTSIQGKTQGVRANGAGNGSDLVRTSSLRDELPEVMSVIIEGDDSESSEKQTTVIGQFNTRTGEFKMNYDRGMFDLKGRRVNGSKANGVGKARGAYYGKKGW